MKGLRSLAVRSAYPPAQSENQLAVLAELPVQIQARVGAEIGLAARDVSGEQQVVDIGLFKPDAGLHRPPGPERRLVLSVGGVDLLVVAEVAGDVGVVDRRAGHRIDVVGDVVEAVVVVLEVVAELQRGAAAQRQGVVGAGLQLHQVLAQSQRILARGRGGQDIVVEVGVVLPLPVDAALEGQAEQFVGPPELLVEAQALALVEGVFVAVAVAIGDGGRRTVRRPALVLLQEIGIAGLLAVAERQARRLAVVERVLGVEDRLRAQQLGLPVDGFLALHRQAGHRIGRGPEVGDLALQGGLADAGVERELQLADVVAPVQGGDEAALVAEAEVGGPREAGPVVLAGDDVDHAGGPLGLVLRRRVAHHLDALDVLGGELPQVDAAGGRPGELGGGLAVDQHRDVGIAPKSDVAVGVDVHRRDLVQDAGGRAGGGLQVGADRIDPAVEQDLLLLRRGGDHYRLDGNGAGGSRGRRRRRLRHDARRHAECRRAHRRARQPLQSQTGPRRKGRREERRESPSRMVLADSRAHADRKPCSRAPSAPKFWV